MNIDKSILTLRGNEFCVSKRSIYLTLMFLILGTVTYVYAIEVNKNDYLLIKGMSLLIIPLVIEGMTFLKGILMKKGLQFLFLFASLVIISQNIFEYHNLSKSSIQLNVGNLSKPWNENLTKNCAFLFNSRNLPSDNYRYVNRTIDYYMESVFREETILDPWTNNSLVRPVDINELSKKEICLALRKPFPNTVNSGKSRLIYEDESWKVIGTNLTFEQAVAEFGALENLQNHFTTA